MDRPDRWSNGEMMAPPLKPIVGPSDTQLLANARRGDDEAFAALVRRYQEQVGRIAIRMLGPGGRDDAEDVSQETFVRFHRGLDQFRGDAAIGTYLTRITINLALNALKRRRWQLARFVRRDANETEPSDELAVETRDELVAAEQRAALEAALGRLDDRHRSVVVLRILEGYSTQHTADLLGLPGGTVMSRLARGLAKLQQDLGARGIGAIDHGS